MNRSAQYHSTAAECRTWWRALGVLAEVFGPLESFNRQKTRMTYLRRE